MLDQLFNSKTRVKVLSLFESNETGRYYLQEIARLTDTDPASIHRELKTLENIEFLESKAEGKQKYFFIKSTNPYWRAVKKLISIYKSQEKDKWTYLGYGKDTFPLINSKSMDDEKNQVFYKTIGVDVPVLDYIAVYDPTGVNMWLKSSELQPILDQYTKVFLEQTDIIFELSNIASEFNKDLVGLAKKWQVLNFSILGVPELTKELQIFTNIHGFVDAFHWPQSLLEMNLHQIDKTLKSTLDIFPQNTRTGIFGLLTTPFENSEANLEYDNLLKILKTIKQNNLVDKYFKETELRLIERDLWRVFPELYFQVRDHAQKYGYLGFGRRGPGFLEDYYLAILKNLLQTNFDISKVYETVQQRQAFLTNEQKELESKLSPKTVLQFQAYRSCIQAKIERKESTYFIFQILPELLAEISKKTNLDIEALRQMYEPEIENLLKNKIPDEKALLDRFQKHIHIVENHQAKNIIEPELSEFLPTINLPNPKPFASINFGKMYVPGRVRGVCFGSTHLEIPDNSILIIDLEKKAINIENLTTNLNKILGIVVLESSKSDLDIAIFARKYSIPCVGNIENKTTFVEGNLIDLDATHAKVVVY